MNHANILAVPVDLYEKCLASKGIMTVVDEGGKEAMGFGAVTSGQAYVYGSAGQLAFAGGITSARGMVEIGPERKVIEHAFSDNRAAPHKMPVYGCSLL